MPTMTKKKKKAGDDRHTRKTRSYRLSLWHVSMLEAIAEKMRWTKTTTLEIAVEELAKLHGVTLEDPPSSTG